MVASGTANRTKTSLISRASRNMAHTTAITAASIRRRVTVVMAASLKAA